MFRGSKSVPFEGGIRTALFIAGGYLPEAWRGKVENGMMHISDWYATFCALNGIDPTDDRTKNQDYHQLMEWICGQC